MSTPNTPQTPETPEIHDAPTTATTTAPTRDTLADEVFVDDGRTAAVPTPAPTAPAAPTPTPAVTGTPPEQQWIEGPAPFAIILGILGLVVAGAVLLGELTDLSLPWNDLGPWSVVAAGLVVLLVGAIGLRSSRTRS
jgi:hypothetical protein